MKSFLVLIVFGLLLGVGEVKGQLRLLETGEMSSVTEPIADIIFDSKTGEIMRLYSKYVGDQGFKENGFFRQDGSKTTFENLNEELLLIDSNNCITLQRDWIENYAVIRTYSIVENQLSLDSSYQFASFQMQVYVVNNGKNLILSDPSLGEGYNFVLFDNKFHHKRTYSEPSGWDFSAISSTEDKTTIAYHIANTTSYKIMELNIDGKILNESTFNLDTPFRPSYVYLIDDIIILYGLSPKNQDFETMSFAFDINGKQLWKSDQILGYDTGVLGFKFIKMNSYPIFLNWIDKVANIDVIDKNSGKRKWAIKLDSLYYADFDNVVEKLPVWPTVFQSVTPDIGLICAVLLKHDAKTDVWKYLHSKIIFFDESKNIILSTYFNTDSTIIKANVDKNKITITDDLKYLKFEIKN